MAYVAGETSQAFNKAYVGESLGSGDGSTTVFALTFTNPKAKIEGVTFYWEMNGTPKNATSDSSGVISHSDFNSCQVTEDGINVDFVSAPLADDDFSADYVGKGVLQKLLDTVAADNHDETLATGNGATSSYSGTLAATGVALGQALLIFTIAGQTRFLWLKSTDVWGHDDITTATLNRATGAYNFVFADNLDDGTPLRIIYSTGADGEDWIALDSQLTQDNGAADAFPGLLLQEVVLTNSGDNGDDRIFVGYRECQSVANSYYSIDLTGFFHYEIGGGWIQSANGTGGHAKTTYDSTRESYTQLPRVALNDDVTTYEYFLSKNAIIAAYNITGDRDVGFYTGNVIRVAPPSRYPYPLLISGTATGSITFTNTGADHSSIIEHSTVSNKIMMVDENNHFRHPPANENLRCVPKTDETALSNAIKRGADDDLERYPVLMHLGLTDTLLGQMEKVFYCPDNLIQSGNTITKDADTFSVIQNVFRNEDTDFLCIKR